MQVHTLDMNSATVTRQTMGGAEMVTVRVGRMTAYAMRLGGQTGAWTVTIGRNVIRTSAVELRANRAVLRRGLYARALYRVELGKA